MSRESRQYTLQEFKKAAQLFAEDNFLQMTADQRRLLKDIHARDIERIEKRLQQKLARINAHGGESEGEDAADAPPEAEESPASSAGDPKETTEDSDRGVINRPAADSFDRVIHHALSDESKAAPCDRCGSPLYRHEPSVVIRIVSDGVFKREKHLLECLRCKTCGSTRTAAPDFSVRDLIHQFSPYAAATLIVMHYYLGMPFKRLQTLMKFYSRKLAASTQWDVVYSSSDRLQPLFFSLWLFARENAKNMRIDDAGAKILSVRARDGTRADVPRSVNTTALYFEMPEGRRISLFYTGQHHAGEISDVLARQRQNPKALARVSDAASKNYNLTTESQEKYIDACCNEHAFAYFRKLKDSHPAEYGVVAEIYGNIFENDRTCTLQKLSDEQRLKYHQKYSAPEMQRLLTWVEMKLKTEFIEDNSPVGKAIHYLANQFVKLTEFLRSPGIPLDSNRVEQFLRVSKRYFKNSSFYKNHTGAEVGDMMMSLVRTAVDAQVSPVDYIAWCLENHEHLKTNPEAYYPWTYKEHLATRQAAAS